MEEHVDTDPPATNAGASDADSAVAEQASELLADLARGLHAVAVPSGTIEWLIAGIARRHGVQARAVLFQSAMVMQVGRGPGAHTSLERMEYDTHFRLAKTHALVMLGRALVSGRLSLDAGRQELARIQAAPGPYSARATTIARAVYGAAVAARIGGGWLEMAAGAVTGVATSAIQFGKVSDRTSDLQKSFLAGLAGGLCVIGLALVLPPFVLAHALFGGVALLVPALIVAIGVHELATGTLESGVLRLVYGLLRFALLAGGIAAAASLLPLIGLTLPTETVTVLPVGALVAVLLLGGVALGVCLQARPGDVPWIVGAVMLAAGTQELTKIVFGGRGVPMLSAFVVGVAAQLYARGGERTAAIVVVPGLLQLTPGFLGTGAALHALRGTDPGHQTFLIVLLEAFQLATGLLVARVLFPAREDEVG